MLKYSIFLFLEPVFASYNFLSNCLKRLLSYLISTNNSKDKIRLKECLQSSVSYTEWSAIALRLDIIEYKDQWKKDPRSAEYDYLLLTNLMLQMKDAKRLKKLDQLQSLITANLSRTVANISNPRLYDYCYIGTKNLIDEFVNEIVSDLNWAFSVESFGVIDKLNFFENLQKSYGSSALVLSGGAALGAYHIGVCHSLYYAGLMPKIIAGSSSGSIIAAFICTRKGRELEDALSLKNINLDFFGEPPDEPLGFLNAIPRFLRRLRSLLNSGTVFDLQLLQICIQQNFGDITFKEAYNKTKMILNITVSSTSNYEMPRILNYVTAPNVLIWSAIMASCSMPALFKSSPILATDHEGNIRPWNPNHIHWIDGSLEGDIPLQRLSELFNVNHFIVSQVNPHIYISSKIWPNCTLLARLFSIVHTEFNYRLTQLIEAGIMPNFFYKIFCVINQEYHGNITIIPKFTLVELFKALSRTTPEFIARAIINGSRSSWPKLSMIRNQLAIEQELDRIIQILERQITS